MDFTVEVAGTDQDSFTDVFGLLVALHKEGGYAPLDVEVAAPNAWHTMAEGMTLLARDGAGKPIGTLALTELQFWYSTDTYLQDGWFYVRPAWRNRGVGVALMRKAREIADAKSKIMLVTVTNPDKRPKKTDMTLMSQNAGYVPVGYTIRAR